MSEVTAEMVIAAARERWPEDNGIQIVMGQAWGWGWMESCPHHWVLKHGCKLLYRSIGTDMKFITAPDLPSLLAKVREA